MAAGRLLEKWLYIRNGLTDGHEIWLSEVDQSLKFRTFKNKDGGKRPPS